MQATTAGRISSQQIHPEVCVEIILASALFHRVSAQKVARRGTLLEDPKENTEGFGPLKVVLAVFADREVGP